MSNAKSTVYKQLVHKPLQTTGLFTNWFCVTVVDVEHLETRLVCKYFKTFGLIFLSCSLGSVA